MAISCEFGSGGRELGKRLADLTGFDYYDSEIISDVTKSSGLNAEYVERTLSDHGWQNQPISFRGTLLSNTYFQSSRINLLLEQKKVIEEMMNTQNLQLTSEWDKTFPKSDKVEHRKVTFINRYGITLAADLYQPKAVHGKLPGIAVCGPFGAVKEKCSGLYAQTMAEKGFLTLAFDPSFTGESGGTPRYMASPDINTEDFQAAVDFLSVQENADPERIGIIGICGWGGLALNAAAIDTRIKATVASTMYDMSRVNANGYFDSEDSADARYEKHESTHLAVHQRNPKRGVGHPRTKGALVLSGQGCLC